MWECLPSMCEALSSACSTEERKVRKKKKGWEEGIDGGGAGREGDREQEKGGKSRDEHCTVGRGVWNG